MEQVYTEYFKTQAGGGKTTPSSIGPVYQASFSRQNGRGCCGLTGRYVSAVATPLLARGVKALSEEAAAAGYGFYTDMANASGPVTFRQVRDAAVSRIAEAGRNLKRRARRTLTGRGSKRRVKRKPKVKRAKPKKRTKARRTRKRTQTGAGHASARSSTPFDIFS